MISSRPVLCVCLAILAGFFDVLCASEESTAQTTDVSSKEQILNIEREIINSRRTITTGRVVFTRQLNVFIQDPSQVGLVTSGTIVFDDNSIRADRTCGESKSQQVYTPNTVILASNTDKVVQVSRNPYSGRPPTEIPYPPFLGIAVWFFSTMNQKGFEELLLNPNRSDFKAELVTDGDEQFLRVRFQFTKQGSTGFGEYRLDSNDYTMPRYVELQFGEGDSKYVRSVSTRYKVFDGVSFPSQVIFKIVRGGEVHSEEIVEIQDANFGQISESAFTLAGLGLPEGKGVYYHGRRGVWNGKEVANRRENQENADGLIERRLVIKYIFLVSAVLFALIAGTIWRFRRNGPD